jgi:hypothetical protein
MDIPENNINFKTMLQRLMVEFVKDEEKKNEERRIEIECKQKEERDRLKEEREKRKQEALERYGVALSVAPGWCPHSPKLCHARHW